MKSTGFHKRLLASVGLGGQGGQLALGSSRQQEAGRCDCDLEVITSLLVVVSS